jgi:O-methyltransferase domain/Dimerisation domain
MAESSYELIVQTALGFGLPRSLHVVAELGVADHLGERPATAEELAKAVGAHPESLGRLLRVLSDHGIFQRQSGKFSHTAASQLLRSDHPQSLRSYVRMIGLPWFWGSYQYLDTAVRTGRPALDRVLPEGIWAHFEARPEEARIFNEAMTGKAQADIGAVVASYNFSRFSMIGDIGGGRGHLLAGILQANHTARGVLFDLPNVVQSVQGIASERLKLQGGDFFKDKLPACDAYTLMEVIHDWNDADSETILSAVRRAAAKGAKLLLIEQMLPETSTPNISALLDVAMMTLLGGKQRTLSEYEALYQAAGFRLDRVIPMPSGASSIIEGTAV